MEDLNLALLLLAVKVHKAISDVKDSLVQLSESLLFILSPEQFIRKNCFLSLNEQIVCAGNLQKTYIHIYVYS